MIIPKFQTFVMDIDKGKVFETTDDKGQAVYIQTDFDMKIDDFMESVISSGGMIQAVQCIAVADHLVAFIQYVETQSPLAIPQNKLQLNIPA